MIEILMLLASSQEPAREAPPTADEPPAWYALGLDREYPVVPEITARAVEAVPGHTLAECVQEEIEQGERGTLLRYPDGVLFAAPRFTIRRLPDPEGEVPWHVHLILEDGREEYRAVEGDSLVVEAASLPAPLSHIVIATNRVEARARYFGDVPRLLEMQDVPPSLRRAAEEARPGDEAETRQVDGATWTHIADEVVVIPEYTISLRVLPAEGAEDRLARSPFATRLGSARLDGRDRSVWALGLSRNVNERTVELFVPDRLGADGEDLPAGSFTHSADPTDLLVPSFTVQSAGQALSVVPVPVELVRTEPGAASLRLEHPYFESVLEVPVPPGVRPESSVERGFRRAVFWPATATPTRHLIVATRANTTRRVTQVLEIPAGGGVERTEVSFDPAEEPSFTIVLTVRFVPDPEELWGPSSPR